MLYVIGDIETTGFNTKLDNILEFGCIMIDEKLNIDRSGTLWFYKPEWKIEGTENVNGLTRKFLAEDYLNISGVRERVESYNEFLKYTLTSDEGSLQRYWEDNFKINIMTLRTLFEKCLFIGKNSRNFDIPFIKDFIDKNLYIDCFPPIADVDVQPLMTKYYKAFCNAIGKPVSSRKVGTLEEQFIATGFTFKDADELYDKLNGPAERKKAHGALYDCCMTYFVLKYLIEQNEVSLK